MDLVHLFESVSTDLREWTLVDCQFRVVLFLASFTDVTQEEVGISAREKSLRVDTTHCLFA